MTLRFALDHRWAPGRMSAYLDDELAARGRARMERHAAECPECRAVLLGLRRMLAALRAQPAPRAPDRAALVAVVRAQLHDRPT
jgi:anti-sigma factor RsiW